MADRRRASVVSDDAGATAERQDNDNDGSGAASASASASAAAAAHAHPDNGAGVEVEVEFGGSGGAHAGGGPSIGDGDGVDHHRHRHSGSLENGPRRPQHWYADHPQPPHGYGPMQQQPPQPPHPPQHPPYQPHHQHPDPSAADAAQLQPPPAADTAAYSLATVQYYEARMRDHAAAYATAAAGAAWAAAQIAGGGAAAADLPADPSCAAAADQARAAAASASTAVAGLQLPSSLPVLLPPVAYPPPGGGAAVHHHPNQQPHHPNQYPNPPDLNGYGYGPPHYMDPMAHGSFPPQEEQVLGSSDNHRVGIYEPVLRHHQPPPYHHHHGGMNAEGYAGGYNLGSGPNKRHQPTSSHHESIRNRRSSPCGNAGPHRHPEPMSIDPAVRAEPGGSGAKKQKRSQGHGLKIDGRGVGASSGADAAGTKHDHRNRTLWYPPNKSRSRRGAERADPQTHEHENEDAPATDRRGRRRNRGDLAGTSSGNSSCDGAKRSGWKKNKASSASGPHCNQNAVHGYHHHHQSGPKPFNPVGKTGVSALHELCDKRHWGAPRFVEVQLNNSTTGTSKDAAIPGQLPAAPSSSSQPLSNPREFFMNVSIDERELGRGRGGTKASARQDAARRALVALLPGVAFDSNGILLHLGGGMDPKAVQYQQRRSTSLEDLAPNLASIVIGNTNRDGYLSPAPSEDSSISTAVSTTHSVGSSGGGRPVVVLGGPAGNLKHQSRATNNIYPCASTTSGVSSASEDNGEGGDDAYYASRGASVCSALLHAMAQIDPRIREPPTYNFDVCANPAAVVPAVGGVEIPPKSTKRKGGGGDGGVVASRKRQSATNAVGTSVTVHRSTFACTTSLVLYAPEKDAAATLQNKSDEANESVPRKKDSFTKTDSKADEKSTSCPSDSDACSKIQNRSEECEGRNVCDGVAQEKLEAVGTGATKREARHVASAKLLALLFPECSGMVEVKAAAEAAREKYAASKALSKQSMRTLTSSGANTKRASRRRKNNPKGATSGDTDNELLASLLPSQGEFALPSDVAKRIRVACGACGGLDESSPDAMVPLTASPKSKSVAVDVSVAALSISDTSEAKPNVTGSCTPSHTALPQESSTTESSLRQLARQKQLEDEVDAALQLLEECDEDRRLSSRDGPIDDVGRTVLRRAGPEDSNWVYSILSRSARKNGTKFKAFNSSLNLASTISPLLQLGAAPNPEGSEIKSEELTSLASLLWGGTSVILVLSRAVAACNEPPLGCAVLTLGFSLIQGRTLTVSEIAQEEHLPYERFVECLESFATIMKCSLNATNRRVPDAAVKDGPQSSSLTLRDRDLRKLVRQYSWSQKVQAREKELDTNEHSSTLHHLRRKAPSLFLQSVKEEEGDEDEDDALESNSELEQHQGRRTHDKPSKRTRVA